MNKKTNIYKILSEREKYILNKLEIKEEDLIKGNIENVHEIMIKMTDQISQLPITREQLISALDNYCKPHKEIFKDILLITSDADYPDIKVNIFKILSNENRNIIKLLGIKLEDKEITSKEYHYNLDILSNKLLMKYNTVITKKECYNLIDKIDSYFQY